MLVPNCAHETVPPRFEFALRRIGAVSSAAFP
jgi:hypothetical protein